MKKALVLILALALTACGKHYSDGSRSGVVTKLSRKGYLCKTWDGEMLMALPTAVAGAQEPEKFCFDVDDCCVAKVQAAMLSGRRVELVYRQWAVAPWTVGHDYVIVDVK